MSLSRRKLLGGIGAATAAGVVGVGLGMHGRKQPRLDLAVVAGSKPYNILLVTSDQEQGWSLLPQGLIDTHCPGRARLQRESLSFSRALTPTPVCSTARAVLYTGQHSQNNGVWDNIPLPYAPTLKRDAPTLGTLMGAAGYHTAYFGKWHLSRLYGHKHAAWTPEQVRDEIQSFGFDEVGTTHEHDGVLGGHRDDTDTTDRAVAFLQAKAGHEKPWFAAVNIVNPHDIMYFTSGPEMTATRKINYPDDLARPPQTAIYQQDLGYPLPANFGPVDLSTRVPAATEYALCDEIAMGQLPYDNERVCREFVNYYYNCIRESDLHIVRLLDALDASGQADNTIVIFTADHGEMLGVHGLRGKGALPYREAMQVPLLVRHPQFAAAASTTALASHIDMAPTLLGLAGVPADSVKREVPELVGRDLSGVILRRDTQAPRGEEDDGLLMHWTSFIYQDHVAALAFDEERKKSGATNLLVLRKPQFRGLITKRGQMRGVYDGRYKFARYFAPTQHHTPRTWEELIARNDLELYDTQEDPGETRNLAREPEAVRELVMTMNAKLNRLIKREVGSDDGHHLPGPGFLWRA